MQPIQRQCVESANRLGVQGRAVRKALVIEVLEDRTLLSTINWDIANSPTGGDWNTASNWVGGMIPGSTDDAIIGLNSGTVTINTGANDVVNSLVTNQGSTLDVSSGTLITLRTSKYSPINGNLTIDGGVLGGGVFTVRGTTTWTSGSIQNTNIDCQGTLLMGKSDAQYKASLFLVNSVMNNDSYQSTLMTGSTDGSASGIFLDKSQFHNYAALTIYANVGFFNGSAARDGVLYNEGILGIAADAGKSTIDVRFDETSGRLVIATGTLALTGPFPGFNQGQSELYGTYFVYGILEFPNALIHKNGAGLFLLSPSADIRDMNGNSALNNLTSNEGIFAIGGGRNFSADSFTNSGYVDLRVGSTLTVANGYTQSGGATRLNAGTLTSSNTIVDIKAGRLYGWGTINGNVSNAGQVQPGEDPEPGMISILGNYSQSSKGTLTLGMGTPSRSSPYDALSVSGTATIDGNLSVTSIQSYKPLPPTAIRAFTFASKTGDFSTETGLDFGDRYLAPSYDPTSLVLTPYYEPVTTPPSPIISDSGAASFVLTAQDGGTSDSSLQFTITSLPAGILRGPDGTILTVGSTLTGSPVALSYQAPNQNLVTGNYFDVFTYTVGDALKTIPPTSVVLSHIASPSTGIVTFQGTPSDDVIAATNYRGKLQFVRNGVVARTTFPVGSITQLNLLGGDGNDTIQITGLPVNAYLDGGTGTNLLIVEGTSGVDNFTVSGSSVGYSGATISGTSPLIVNGLGGDDTFKIVAPNSAATLNGGDGNDTFVFSGGATLIGSIDGGLGSNSLNDSAVTTPLTLDLGSATITGLSTSFANIQNVIGGTNAGNTIKGSAAATTFNITGANAGNVAGFNFTKFGALVGGAGNDVFKFTSGGSLTGGIDGGAGTNTIDESALTTQVTLNLATSTVSLVTGAFANIQSVLGGTNTTNQVLAQAAGTTFNITGANIGNAAGIGFTRFGYLVGGAGNDVFKFSNAATLSGTINGGAGTNTVDQSSYLSATSVNLSTSKVTAVGVSFASIQAFIAGTYSVNQITGPNAATVFNVTAANKETISGITFSGFGYLVGGTANDSFVFSLGASLTGSINGGTGTNTLDLSAFTKTITVNMSTSTVTGVGSTFSSIQTFIGGSNATNAVTGPATGTTFNITALNTFNANGLNFSSFRKIVGGAGEDSFVLSDGAGLSSTIDGGAGTNWLDYSAYTTGITVNLATGAATGFGSATANIVNVRGGSGNDNLTGNSKGNILIGGGGADTLTGGTGVSLLIGGTGADIVNGGSGGDLIIGGSTSYDNNNAALDSILAEWRLADSYATRIADIKNGGGLNGTNVLNLGTTVVDDLAANILTGAPGAKNWYFKGTKDSITDLQPGEQVN